MKHTCPICQRYCHCGQPTNCLHICGPQAERCVARTKNRVRCVNFGNRIREGQRYCHIHDPEGIFQEQLRAHG